jgi:hypothetical protein
MTPELSNAMSEADELQALIAQEEAEEETWHAGTLGTKAREIDAGAKNPKTGVGDDPADTMLWLRASRAHERAADAYRAAAMAWNNIPATDEEYRSYKETSARLERDVEIHRAWQVIYALRAGKQPRITMTRALFILFLELLRKLEDEDDVSRLMAFLYMEGDFGR